MGAISSSSSGGAGPLSVAGRPASRVTYELDDLPAVQKFVAAGIAVVPMHGLTLATLPPGATTRPLAEQPAGSRTVEALAPAAGRTPVVDELLGRLASAAVGYTP